MNEEKVSEKATEQDLQHIRTTPCVTISELVGCRRCGKTHHAPTQFLKLSNPGMLEVTHFYICEETGQPGLIGWELKDGAIGASML